jgi:hypothetical protein
MILSLLRIVRHSYHPHTAVLVNDEKGERLTPTTMQSILVTSRTRSGKSACRWLYHFRKQSDESN